MTLGKLLLGAGLVGTGVLVDKFAHRLGIPWNENEQWFWERLWPTPTTIRKLSPIPKTYGELHPAYRGGHYNPHNPAVQADAPLRFHVGNPGKLLSRSELYRVVKKQPKIKVSKELRYTRTPSKNITRPPIYVSSTEKAY